MRNDKDREVDIDSLFKDLYATPWTCPLIDIIQMTIKKYSENGEVIDKKTVNMLENMLEDVRQISHENRATKLALGTMLEHGFKGYVHKYSEKQKKVILNASTDRRTDRRLTRRFALLHLSSTLDVKKDFNAFKNYLIVIRQTYKRRSKEPKL